MTLSFIHCGVIQSGVQQGATPPPFFFIQCSFKKIYQTTSLFLHLCVRDTSHFEFGGCLPWTSAHGAIPLILNHDDDDSQHLYGAIYLFQKHSKARALPIKLAFKCLKEDVSFEWSFAVVKVVNFANRWWEGISQARSNREKFSVSISFEMSTGHLESKARWAKSRRR